MKSKRGLWLLIAIITFSGVVTEQVYGQLSSQARSYSTTPPSENSVKREDGTVSVIMIRVELISEVAGTVLLNGSGTGFYQQTGNTSIEAKNNITIAENKTMTILVRGDAPDKRLFFSVKDADGNIHSTSNTRKLSSTKDKPETTLITIKRNQSDQQQISSPAPQTQVVQPAVPPADTFKVEQLANNTLAVIGYNGNIRNIIISDTMYGLKVTEIRNFGFIKVSNNYIEVGWRQDSRRNSIESITFPDSVTKIGVFTQTVQPDTPERIYMSSVDLNTGERTKNDNYGLRQLTFGKGLVIIGDMEFYDNPKLTQVIIPNTVVEIGNYTFYYSSLTSVTLPNGLKKIGNKAFASNNIQSVSIPGNVQNLGVGVFADNPISRAVLPANLSNDVMQRWGFESGLINFYTNQNRAAGTYVKNGPIWTRQ